MATVVPLIEGSLTCWQHQDQDPTASSDEWRVWMGKGPYGYAIELDHQAGHGCGLYVEVSDGRPQVFLATWDRADERETRDPVAVLKIGSGEVAITPGNGKAIAVVTANRIHIAGKEVDWKQIDRFGHTAINTARKTG